MSRRSILAAVSVALAVLAGGSTADAQQASRLRVTQTETAQPVTERWLHLAEVQAFEAGTGTNVAASANGGVASSSGIGFGGLANRANDGNTNGNYAANSVYHSDASAVGEFWEVAFANPATIESISIFGRSDCCQIRDDDLRVQLFDAGGNVIFAREDVRLFPNTGQGLATLVVPEPTTFTLAGLGLMALAVRRPGRR